MKRACLLLFVCAACGCSSLHLPLLVSKPNFNKLPVEAVKAAAQEVEKSVQAGTRDFVPADREGLVFGDDKIKQAIRTRAVRSELVNELLDSGFGREDQDGLLSIQSSGEYKRKTTSRDRDKNALIVMSENNDRWALFEGIAATNKYGSGSVAALQQTFHEARIANMKSGQKYQDASGKTVAK